MRMQDKNGSWTGHFHFHCCFVCWLYCSPVTSIWNGGVPFLDKNRSYFTIPPNKNPKNASPHHYCKHCFWAVGPLARLQSVTELLGFQRAAAWAAGEKCRALVVDSWSVRGLYERISPAQPMVVEFCWFFLHPTQQILELYGIIKWVYYFHLHKSSIKSYQIIDKISIIINHSL